MCSLKKIDLLVICVFLALIVAACAPRATEAPQPVGEKESQKELSAGTSALEDARQRGGKFSMNGCGVFGNPNDPHLTGTCTGRGYAVPVTNQLAIVNLYDSNFGIIPDLAKSWEASKDGLTYTFKLQEGVKFHNTPPVNGREFTSEDAKYSLLRITADPSIIVDKWKPRFQRRLEFGKIKSIETPDKYTLVVKLEEPHAPFMDAVSQVGTVMLPREFVETFPEKIILEGMIGTGPFIPVDFKNQLVATYKRNPDYWKKDSQGQQLPYVDELSYVSFSDTQAELAAFRSGQLDATVGFEPVPGTLDNISKGVPGTKVIITPNAGIWNFRFNMKFKPFQDVRVRKAIHLAVDRHQFLEVMSFGRGVIAGPVTGNVGNLGNTIDWLLSQPGFRKDKSQDLEEARRLMREAGFGDGLTIGGMFSSGATSGDFAALLTDQLKPLKITLKAELVDYAGQWIPRSTNGEFEFSHMRHVYSADPDSLLSTHFRSGGGRNYGKFNDTVLDDLIDKQRTATNFEERKKWAQEAEKRILDQVPMIFLYRPSLVVLAQPWTHNVGQAPLNGSEVTSVERVWVDKH